MYNYIICEILLIQLNLLVILEILILVAFYKLFSSIIHIFGTENSSINNKKQ